MKRIQVAAAVIRCKGKILIAQRPQSKHQGGLWEFPGGKVEAGEDVLVALARELDEELGIQLQSARPLISVTHDYPDKSVCLDVWEVCEFQGEAYGREGQPVRWVEPAALTHYTFPAANFPILAAARLPDCYFITPEQDEAALLDWLDKRKAQGARLILLRQPNWKRERYLAFAEDFQWRCREAEITLLLHGDVDLLQAVDAEGLHLPAWRFGGLAERPLPAGKWLAASVHDAQELAQAAAIGVDFVTLSPVQATLSHLGASVLGWEGFARLAQQAPMPVYALGGMTAADVDCARAQGGQGIAGIRGL